MTDSITRQDLAAKLLSAGWWDMDDVKKTLDVAFPPKFEPKVGQVVAVWRDYGQVKFDKFKLMDSTKAPYVCEISDWHNCRALTAEEKGEL